MLNFAFLKCKHVKKMFILEREVLNCRVEQSRRVNGTLLTHCFRSSKFHTVQLLFIRGYSLFVIAHTNEFLFPQLPSPSQTAKESAEKPTVEQNDFDQPCFTKKEVRDILFERNELKTNLFLVQEELNYYQRWVLKSFS